MTTKYAKSKDKSAARDATIFGMYKHFAKSKKIPKDKQYYCLCAQCYDPDKKKILRGSELAQGLKN